MVNGRCVFTVTKLTYADKPPSGTGTLSGTYLVLEVPLGSVGIPAPFCSVVGS
jgi:hypothetical protein